MTGPADAAPAPWAVFDQLTGQEQVVGQLRAAVTSGRPAHAWMFTGPPGSGRSVAARAFAAALLCPERGCGRCPACRQVAAGSHADLLLVRPDGLSFGVRLTRELVLRAAAAPVSGPWRIVLFEDADRATEQAANALLKAIEEPPSRTIWLLCAPSAADLPVTIRSRCAQVALRQPPVAAVAALLEREGVASGVALAAARASLGHIGRARRLATDPQAAGRRAEVLAVPARARGLSGAFTAAQAIVKAAETDAETTTQALDEPEREAMRRALGEGSTGKGVASMVRGAAGALKDLEERQKSRATRIKRDSLDLALLDLASFYRDVLAVQFGAAVELANADREGDVRAVAAAGDPASTIRRIEAIMRCRERLAANVTPLLAVEEMALALAGHGADG